MIITKAIRGEVVQYYDTRKKRYISQHFDMDDCDAIHFENEMGEEIPEEKALQKMNRAFLMHDMVQPPKPLTKRAVATLLENLTP